MSVYRLSHLEALEAEALHVLREVAAEADRPALMFSGGKDSIVMLHLARLAFWPAPVPFPVLHVDTGHNFPEVLAFRDRLVEEWRLRLVVSSVPEMIADGRIVEPPGETSRNRLQTPALLEAVTRHRFDALFGGARRDEEKARAKERVLSFRDEFGQWDPKNQRPELWNLYNGLLRPGEHLRVFPLSNWTELDVWQYIAERRIDVPSIYFAHKREVFRRDGMIFSVGPYLPMRDGESSAEEQVRFRTVGDMSCTGAVSSTATTVEEVLREVAASRLTERGATRADDRVNESAMEDRKREGYF
ncbi:sulfate adenylyltransferase subunit CysD [Micromonospora sp. AMSO1212t]|uniref:sulfate adenylyltransferase subunit CysD n=1 Tax=Micromonospora sp. AMSO1212t TaxID=2650565 RepID=UPI00124B9441|nr:sulfate adenylyltransferase subunit CysD [Micromonospora sp. AMSO1212t]KAB1904382.1 sulfate adenylyltransferase subunit CysD [Micromonospora sp. AMSO1212t]